MTNFWLKTCQADWRRWNWNSCVLRDERSLTWPNCISFVWIWIKDDRGFAISWSVFSEFNIRLRRVDGQVVWRWLGKTPFTFFTSFPAEFHFCNCWDVCIVFLWAEGNWQYNSSFCRNPPSSLFPRMRDSKWRALLLSQILFIITFTKGLYVISDSRFRNFNKAGPFLCSSV